MTVVRGEITAVGINITRAYPGVNSKLLYRQKGGLFYIPKVSALGPSFS